MSVLTRCACCGCGCVQLTWRVLPVFTKKDLKQLEAFRLNVLAIADQEKGTRGMTGRPTLRHAAH